MLLRRHTFVSPSLGKHKVYDFNLFVAHYGEPESVSRAKTYAKSEANLGGRWQGIEEQITSNVELTRWRVEKIIEIWEHTKPLKNFLVIIFLPLGQDSPVKQVF